MTTCNQVGTYGYCAPEVLKRITTRTRTVSNKIDIFAVTATAYDILYGETVFHTLGISVEGIDSRGKRAACLSGPEKSRHVKQQPLVWPFDAGLLAFGFGFRASTAERSGRDANGTDFRSSPTIPASTAHRQTAQQPNCPVRSSNPCWRNPNTQESTGSPGREQAAAHTQEVPEGAAAREASRTEEAAVE